ncbi:DUF4177 domain-containing protein [Roseimicrobium sp. ORNL1]|uniref:DUF4177 domain-containing protein n=1 Tax=Roseimicrobium sp. ORNL1 TaxID=2711231 RepID=UPI0013E1A3E0|nr:DUF4177 domain-containing protein [Roseimicrobium sp. ORNL1]QIF02516.1 DUF4177 domain-containing protein [Roseimicrobium sp. ORNL1]
MKVRLRNTVLAATAGIILMSGCRESARDSVLVDGLPAAAWEYKVIESDYGNKMEAELNRLAKEGWFVIGFVDHANPNDHHAAALLKRPIHEAKNP